MSDYCDPLFEPENPPVVGVGPGSRCWPNVPVPWKKAIKSSECAPCDDGRGAADLLARVASAWEEEASEREARAQNMDVVGMIERLTEEAAVRVLRRCAAELRGDRPDPCAECS